MPRRTRRTHSPSFKAKVAIAAMRKARKTTTRPPSERIRIAEPYRGLTGIERCCREECNRSGPASARRVYAYLWSCEGQAHASERTIQHGAGLSERVAADAIYALFERGIVEIED